MPDTELDEALLAAARDLGLGDPSLITVDASCRTALQREFERERPRARPRLHRPLRRAMVVPLSVLLLGMLVAVGYAALTGSSTSSDGIECHDNGKLDGGGSIVGLDGRPATKTCAQLWTEGAVGDGVHGAPGPLHACVDRDGGGAIHVFASADRGICARVGLREDPMAGAGPAERRYARFTARLSKQLTGAAFACRTRTQLRQLVERLLRASAMTDWTVTDAGGSERGDPCAGLALNSDTRTVTISTP